MFPALGRAFRSIRQTFEAFDTQHSDGDRMHSINYSDLKGALHRLGADCTDEEVAEFFHESDMYGELHCCCVVVAAVDVIDECTWCRTRVLDV